MFYSTRSKLILSFLGISFLVCGVALLVQAWKEAASPFRLATCGWVLGPPSNRTLFDQVLPKDVAMSTINREVGKAPVDPAVAATGSWPAPR